MFFVKYNLEHKLQTDVFFWIKNERSELQVVSLVKNIIFSELSLAHINRKIPCNVKLERHKGGGVTREKKKQKRVLYLLRCGNKTKTKRKNDIHILKMNQTENDDD